MSRVVVEMTGEEAQLWRAQQRILAQTRQLEAGYGRVQRAGRQAATQTSRSFGSRAVSQMATFTTGIIALESATRLLGDAMRFVDQESQGAAHSITSLVDARRRMVQIATSPQDLAELERTADELAVRFGVQRDVVREVMFSARSQDFEQAVPAILGISRFVRPEESSRVAGSLPAVFGGEITPQQAINLTLAAAEKSAFGFEQIAPALQQAAGGGAITGASAAETAAAVSVLAEIMEGSTGARLKALGTKLGLSEEFGGRGFVGGVESLMAASEADRAQFLGESIELNEGFNRFSENLEAIRRRTEQFNEELARTGTTGSMLAGRQATALSDPNIQREIGIVRAQIQRELAREQRFGQGRTFQERRDVLLADMENAGETGAVIYLRDAAGQAARSVGAPEFAARQVAESIGLAGGVFGGLQGAILGGFMDRLSSERIRAAERERLQLEREAAAHLRDAALNTRDATSDLRGAARAARPTFSDAARAQARRHGGGVEAD